MEEKNKLKEIAKWVAKPINHKDNLSNRIVKDGILLVSVSRDDDFNSVSTEYYPDEPGVDEGLIETSIKTLDIAREYFRLFGMKDITLLLPKNRVKVVVKKYGLYYIAVLVKTSHPVNKSLVRFIDRTARRFSLPGVKYKTSMRKNNIEDNGRFSIEGD